MRPLLDGGRIKGMAHITGGGITDNLPRILPHGTAAVIDAAAWAVPPLFRWLQQAGDVPIDDMMRTFNMGIGLIIVTARDQAEPLHRGAGGPRWPRRARHRRDRAGRASLGELRQPVVNRRLGVLISGRGSNLQALIDAIRTVASTPRSPWSFRTSRMRQVSNVRGWRASRRVVIDHRGWRVPRRIRSRARARAPGARRRPGLPRRLHAARRRAAARRLSERDSEHPPSLLPAFPGVDAQHQAIEHGVKVSGVTVHFVTRELDGGPIVLQRAVPVLDGDTRDTLAARILVEEHRAYPRGGVGSCWRRLAIDGRRFVRSANGASA